MWTWKAARSRTWADPAEPSSSSSGSGAGVSRRLGACPNWRSAVSELLTAFFEPDDNEEARLQRVRDGLGELVSQAEAAGFDQSVSLDVLRALLQGLLADTGGAQRFLTGRVSFCNMVPMRSIPFRVVCLIGMNGADFPRSQSPLSFDLMAQHPRRGDRSRRRDDRYLFLEALLSARDVLYLSWVGNDERDNSVKVPSVVIDELLDYLRPGYRRADGSAPVEHLLLHHPLQPFSRFYFDQSDGRLFSYASTWLDAALAEMSPQIPPFCDAALEAPDDEFRTLDTEELIRFLRNPAQLFLTRRLGLRLPDEAEVLEDTEPFDADKLEAVPAPPVTARRAAERPGPGFDAGEIAGRRGASPWCPRRAAVRCAAPGGGTLRAALQGRLSDELQPIEVDVRLWDFRLQGQLRESAT